MFRTVGAVGVLSLLGAPLVHAQTTTTVSGPTVVANGGAPVLGAGDTLEVTATGSIVVPAGNAIVGAGASVSVRNAGTVDASAGGIGIDLNGDSNLVVNTNVLRAQDQGIALDGNTAQILNSGQITSAFDEGITIDGNDATVSNSGTITADQAAINIGFGGGATGDNATVTNSGTVIANNGPAIIVDGTNANIVNTATLRSTRSDGIRVDDAIARVENTGTIRAGDDGIDVIGGGEVILNSGTITADDEGIAAAGANAHVTNSGIVAALGDDGIDLDGANAIATNTGTITAQEDGIDAEGAGAQINNSGSITAGDAGLDNGGDNGQIVNSGTITASVDGIENTGDGAKVTNSGTITALDDGIQSDGDGDQITHSGTITAARDGIETNGRDVTVNNSGKVFAQSDAFDLNGDNSTLNLQEGSLIVGLLSFDGANGTLNYSANSDAWLSTDGGNPVSVTTSRGTVLRDGNTIYVVTPDAGSGLNLDFFGTLNRQIHSDIALNFAKSPSIQVSRGHVSRHRRPWVKTGGFRIKRDASQSSGFTTNALFGMLGLPLADGVGIYAGHAKQTTTPDLGGEISSNTSYLGLAYHSALRSGHLDLSLTFGTGQTEGREQVLDNTTATGIRTVTRTYDQSFISPALTFTRPLGQRAYGGFELRYLVVQTGASTQGVLNYSGQRSQRLAVKPFIGTQFTRGQMQLDLRAGVEAQHTRGDDLSVAIGGTSSTLVSFGSEIEYLGFVEGNAVFEMQNDWVAKAQFNLGISNHARRDLGLGISFAKTF